MRMYLGMLSTNWTDGLSQAQRDGWNVYASNVTVIGPLGDPISLSGQMQYVRTNTARLQAGLAQVDEPPTTFNIGEPPMPSALAIDDGAEFDVTLPTITDGDYIIRIGKPQGAGIGFFKGPFRFQQVAAADVVDGQVTVWPGPIVGQKYWFAFRRAYDDGRLSEQVIVGPVVCVASV